ncbi:MAG: DDE-type integrase/transposase/recombinase [Acidobacteriota bacterium]|nr:MAG: DDE-type integrase/transposase/recombinase [Acidobacteriota bacterium]
MFRVFTVIVVAFRGLALSRADLILENLALRQQLAILKARSPRPRTRPADRLFWTILHRAWPRWRDPLVLVKPETVIRWHRAGFRRYWRWKSRLRRGGRPRVDVDIRHLIRRMVKENPIWGSPRVHGELLKLGFEISETTVRRYMRRRSSDPETRQRWRTFLENHRDVIAAMDFFTVPTVTFQILYVFFVIHHARRKILHVNVTISPSSAWICQQLREAFPFDTAPRYLVFDRDSKFGGSVLRTIQAFGIEAVRTSFKSPWQNGVAERWVASVRRDLVNHLIVFNRSHLRRRLRSYVRYYHEDRCHLSLAKDCPSPRRAVQRPSPNATVVPSPRVGGLHHRYYWREAA